MKYHGRDITWERVWRKLKYEFSGVRMFDFADAMTDLRVCGRVLNRYVPSIFRNDREGKGYTGSQQTHYAILKRIFRHVELKSGDRFLDVGCGKGRVLAFLIHEKLLPLENLNGVEINPISFKAADWTSRYPGVNVMLGNALEMDYDFYDVLFLNRPFLPKTFLEFLARLESTVTHPITFVYWVDQQSGHFLNRRPGWTLLYRSKIYRINGIPAMMYPQGFSVWTFNPNHYLPQGLTTPGWGILRFQRIGTSRAKS